MNWPFKFSTLPRFVYISEGARGLGVFQEGLCVYVEGFQATTCREVSSLEWRLWVPRAPAEQGDFPDTHFLCLCLVRHVEYWVFPPISKGWFDFGVLSLDNDKWMSLRCATVWDSDRFPIRWAQMLWGCDPGSRHPDTISGEADGVRTDLLALSRKCNSACWNHQLQVLCFGPLMLPTEESIQADGKTGTEDADGDPAQRPRGMSMGQLCWCTCSTMMGDFV